MECNLTITQQIKIIRRLKSEKNGSGIISSYNSV